VRVTGDYASWRGHVIVCGLHGVGLRIVEQLNLSGVPAVVVDAALLGAPRRGHAPPPGPAIRRAVKNLARFGWLNRGRAAAGSLVV